MCAAQRDLSILQLNYLAEPRADRRAARRAQSRGPPRGCARARRQRVPRRVALLSRRVRASARHHGRAIGERERRRRSRRGAPRARRGDRRVRGASDGAGARGTKRELASRHQGARRDRGASLTPAARPSRTAAGAGARAAPAGRSRTPRRRALPRDLSARPEPPLDLSASRHGCRAVAQRDPGVENHPGAKPRDHPAIVTRRSHLAKPGPRSQAAGMCA